MIHTEPSMSPEEARKEVLAIRAAATRFLKDKKSAQDFLKSIRKKS
jgi:hypothetical protein